VSQSGWTLRGGSGAPTRRQWRGRHGTGGPLRPATRRPPPRSVVSKCASRIRPNSKATVAFPRAMRALLTGCSTPPCPSGRGGEPRGASFDRRRPLALSVLPHLQTARFLTPL